MITARRRLSTLLLTTCALALTACGSIPADSAGTLDRARGGTLVVGVSENEPWTDVDDHTGEVSGSESELIEGFADTIDAEVEWVPGSESVLAEQIKEGELDVIIGGLTKKSPWTSHMALTRPYTNDNVMGVQMGENALQVALERYLAEESGEI